MACLRMPSWAPCWFQTFVVSSPQLASSMSCEHASVSQCTPHFLYRLVYAHPGLAPAACRMCFCRAEAVHVQAALLQEVQCPSKTRTDGGTVCAAPRPTGGAPRSRTATGAGRRPTTGTAAARHPTSRRRAGAPHPMSLATGRLSPLKHALPDSKEYPWMRKLHLESGSVNPLSLKG